MSRLTGSDAYGLMEAYQAVYAPKILNEDLLWEEAGYLTEEFILESYQTVADYLVNNGIVPGYNTAEFFMLEMTLEDIDSILFETGILDEEYLIEAGFFQNLGAGVDREANRVRSGVQRAGQTVAGAAQRAGSAVQRAGSAVAGGVQRAGQTVAGAAQRAVTPVAQAVQGTAQRAVQAGQSALGGAARAGQAVVGGVQRAGQAIAGGAAAAGRKIAQEVEISRRVGAGQSPTPTIAAKPVPVQPRRGLGNVPPSEGTGIGGPSDLARKYGRDTTSYQAGGGARSGQNVYPTMQQGRTNLGRMDQGRPAPSTARPTTGPSVVNPKSGVAGFPAARSAAPASSVSRPAAPAATTGNPPLRPPALPPITGRPSLASRTREIRDMQAASRQRQGLTQSFDPFDIVMGHLIDEGYAETEEAASVIMSNMSEEWIDSIVEGVFSTDFRGAVTADADDQAARTHKIVASAPHTSPENRRGHRDAAAAHLVAARRKRRKKTQ